MPYCNGKNGCKIGKPHEIPSKDLLADFSEVKLKQVVNRTLKYVKSKCGGRAALGKQAVKYARKRLQLPVSATAGNSLEQQIKLFDDTFTSKMELKAPGTYLVENGKPVAFVSITDNNRIISREIFAPDLTKDEASRVFAFIRSRIPEAKFDSNSGDAART